MEMTMHDFAAQVGESVRKTRDLRRRQADTLRREGEDTARRLHEAQTQAAELVTTTWERVRTAAHASDGALVASRNEHQGVTVFELHWQEGQPSRSLQITVDQAEGMIQAAWIMPTGFGRSVDAPSVGASGFEISKIESVILLLIDQPRWASNAVPPIPW
jgi:hypothetical protein